LLNNVRFQDEKLEPKKDGDVEMKGEEGPAAKPTDGSTNTPEDVKPKRKSEPSSENVANFSRVTPTQLAYISFPPEGRYQPVRPVSLNTVSPKTGGKGNPNPGARKAPSGVASERYAGGGGILLMVDERPDTEAEFISFEPPVVEPAPTENGHAQPQAHHARPSRDFHIALDESSPDVDPPESFEVSGHQQ
jgi:26S proteasome regulatory subunit N2